MTTEYYFECSECGRWYKDESSLAHDDVCIYCATVQDSPQPVDSPF